jgi:regulator of sigma E protease
MEVFIIKAGQLILSLSILVVLHELGHFIPAKLFKTRVEKFYLFFNPWFSLIKIKKGDTEYGIGWLPLGGFVKISGMIDESMDKSQMKKPAQPWEFRAKPAWQRLIIMTGGVFVNLIVGAVCFTMVVYVWGTSSIDMKSVDRGFYVSDILEPYGIETGDMVTSIEGKDVKSASWLTQEVLFFGGRNLTIRKKDGTTSEVTLPEDIDYKIIENEGARSGIFGLPISTEIGIVGDSTQPANKAGIKVGDKVLGVNGISTPYWQDMSKEVIKADSLVTFSILRGLDTLSISMLPIKVKKRNIVGINPISIKKMYNYKVNSFTYTFFESVPVGLSTSLRMLWANVVSFKFVFTKKGASEMSGLIGIGNAFPDKWNWQTFWSMTGMLSLVLAFMNILPIPALDGGHVVFLLYEMVVGKKPHEKVMEYAQITGMIFLLCVMVYATGNDIVKFLID